MNEKTIEESVLVGKTRVNVCFITRDDQIREFLIAYYAHKSEMHCIKTGKHIYSLVNLYPAPRLQIKTDCSNFKTS